MSRISILEETLALHLKAHNIQGVMQQFKFHVERRWVVDFAWPDKKIIVEVEGGTWKGGRHTRGVGFRNDCIKYNQATLDGWKVFRFTSDMVKSGAAIETILQALEA